MFMSRKAMTVSMLKRGDVVSGSKLSTPLGCGAQVPSAATSSSPKSSKNMLIDI
jgi:hypothetical protein